MSLQFPVAKMLQPHVTDGRTISRTGRWWGAVLAINSPRDGKPYLGIYKWENVAGEWKKRQYFKINKAKHLDMLMESLNTFADTLTSNDEPKSTDAV